MIFPLKENNYVTLHMMQDYMDLHETARLWDPDEAGNYTIDELKEVAMKVLTDSGLNLAIIGPAKEGNLIKDKSLRQMLKI